MLKWATATTLFSVLQNCAIAKFYASQHAFPRLHTFQHNLHNTHSKIIKFLPTHAQPNLPHWRLKACIINGHDDWALQTTVLELQPRKQQPPHSATTPQSPPQHHKPHSHTTPQHQTQWGAATCDAPIQILPRLPQSGSDSNSTTPQPAHQASRHDVSAAA